ncbi:MAG: tetratricopeptide repeat protein [Chloroflexota bacterium]|nr:tetratricopeptide repeat protein [Chloroflexota bacterium]
MSAWTLIAQVTPVASPTATSVSTLQPSLDLWTLLAGIVTSLGLLLGLLVNFTQLTDWIKKRSDSKVSPQKSQSSDTSSTGIVTIQDGVQLQPQALRSSDSLTSNLPKPTTTLLGRDEEAEAVSRLLLRDGVRLVTLTGPPGSGKTRLGIEVARRVQDQFRSGVVFIPLAAISNADMVLPSIAQALGVRESADRPLQDLLAAFLSDRQMLLLLDNFEQVVWSAPKLFELLAASSELKMLVTSRTLLHISGEYNYPVPPLKVPDHRALPPLDSFMQYASVQLFAARAEAVKPSFRVTTKNMTAVAGICARLDGLPLAIELAAARVRLMEPAQILEGLTDSLKLLKDGSRNLPSRLQTLYNAIAWSYNLLDSMEKQLYRRLSIFVGGCTLEAARAICNARGDLKLEFVDGIAGLIDESLLKYESYGSGEARYSMLETLKEYGLEQLSVSGESEELQHEHARYYLLLAERAEAELRQRNQLIWFERLGDDHDNLRSALKWSRTQGGSNDIGLKIAGALMWFWYVRGFFSEGQGWLTGALEQTKALGDSLARAKAYLGAGYMGIGVGDLATAERMIRKALLMSKRLNEKPIYAYAHLALGEVARLQGNYKEATSRYQTALSIRRELGDDQGVSTALSGLGEMAIYAGDLNEARKLYEESLKLRNEIGDTRGIASGLTGLAYTAAARGDYVSARDFFRESLSLFIQTEDRRRSAECIAGLAAIASVGGQVREAAQLFGACERILSDMGASRFPGDQTTYDRNIASVRSHLGDSVFAELHVLGSQMTFEQTVELALHLP